MKKALTLSTLLATFVMIAEGRTLVASMLKLLLCIMTRPGPAQNIGHIHLHEFLHAQAA